MIRKNPVFFVKHSGRWQHVLAQRNAPAYETAIDAGDAYVKQLVKEKPKYKALFEGKPRSQVFNMVGIVL